MPALRIDYQSRPTTRWVGWVLLCAAVVLGLELGHTREELQEQLAMWDAPVSGSAAARSAGRGDAEKGARPIQIELDEATAVFRQLTMPWPEFFRSLERAHAPDIALLSLQPEAARRAVTISGEAKAYGDVLAYVGRLRAEPQLANVHLTANELRESDPQRPVLFIVSAVWKGAE